MAAYYNEIDPFAAEWLRALIKEGHIASGEVDERDIRDVKPSDLKEFDQCHFFAGIGVWSYALRRAGWPDDRPVWTGSCPCQPHSGAASERAKGFDDPRDLWPTWFNLIRQCQPVTIFGEQVDDSAVWIDRTIIDMEREKFTIGAVDFPACSVDAPFERMRTYFVAFPNSAGFSKQSRTIPMEEKYISPKCSGSCSFYEDHRTTGELGKVRRIKPGVCLLDDVSPARVGRLRGYGNAIVAEQAKAFIESYMEIEI